MLWDVVSVEIAEIGGFYGVLEVVNAQLFHLFNHMLPTKSDSRLDKYYESILNLVVAGHVYKESCLENTGYVNFKPWVKKQAAFADWTPKDFNKFCANVNEASNVFEHWDQIIGNLTDLNSRIDHLCKQDVKLELIKGL